MAVPRWRELLISAAAVVERQAKAVSAGRARLAQRPQAAAQAEQARLAAQEAHRQELRTRPEIQGLQIAVEVAEALVVGGAARPSPGVLEVFLAEVEAAVAAGQRPTQAEPVLLAWLLLPMSFRAAVERHLPTDLCLSALAEALARQAHTQAPVI
jgi:hypothetical protein